MGNIFDPNRVIHNDAFVLQQKRSMNKPHNLRECVLLMIGFIKDDNKATIVPMDIVNTIGIFDSYSFLAEQQAIIFYHDLKNRITIHNAMDLIQNGIRISDAIDKSITILMKIYEQFPNRQLLNLNGINRNKITANFLYYNHKELDKISVGIYFENNYDIFTEYTKFFNFRDETVDEALRTFVLGFKLPTEAQKIDIVLQKFAELYYRDNYNEHNDVTLDTVYIMAYSIIMLNTSLFNPKVRNRMSRTKFLNLTMASLQSEAAINSLEGIYQRVKRKAIC